MVVGTRIPKWSAATFLNVEYIRCKSNYKMKKVLFALLLAAQVMWAQNAQKIIGKWAYADMHNKEELDDMGREMAEKMFASLELNFRTDGTMSLGMMGKLEGGTYVFDASNDKLIHGKSNAGRPMELTITSLTDNELVITAGTLGPLVMKRASATPDAAPAALVTVASNAKQISGKWFLVDKESEKPKSEMFYELISGSYLNFKANGTYEANIIGLKEEGTWKMAPGGKAIVVVTDDGTGEWYITAVSDTDLTLQKGPSAKKHMFSKTQKK